MSQNPYSPPSKGSELQPNAAPVSRLQSRFIFLLTAFSMAVLAFYSTFVDNVFSTPYLEPHIGAPMFIGVIPWAVGFAAVCTTAVGIASLITRRIQAWHYALLFIPFLIEFAASWYFFVAFFGI